MVQSISSYTLALIVIILGVVSVRRILSLLVPRDSNFAWLVHSTYDREILAEAFRELGYSKRSFDRGISSALKRTGHKIREEYELKSASSRLVCVISKYLEGFDRNIKWAQEDDITSNFYINTMSASQNDEDLKIMTKLMIWLISNCGDESTPDFFVTSKNGNSVLAWNTAKSIGGIPILAKFEDRAQGHFPRSEHRNNLIVNFEGSRDLIYQSQDTSSNLTGVGIDCNATTGKTLLNAVDNFNYFVDHLPYNINKIEECYILYRPVDAYNIDDLFSDHGLTLYRLFDLSENAKANLHSTKRTGNNDGLVWYKNSDRDEALDYVHDLSDEGLLKINVE